MKSFSKSTCQFLCISFSVVNLIGCATMVNGTDQTISVETRADNKEITGASCELKNKSGEYQLTSPASISVKRVSDDLIIACNKEAFPKGAVRADSGLNNAVWGNILVGGLIGLVVDAGTGAINEYPDLVVVELGKNLFVEGDEYQEVNKSELYDAKVKS